MHDPFGGDKLDRIAGDDDMHMPSSSSAGGGGGGSAGGSPTRDRRMSKEWDASKVPPSRFQKRSGSIYSTPSSRDAHLTGTGSERDKGYWEKMKEKVSEKVFTGKSVASVFRWRVLGRFGCVWLASVQWLIAWRLAYARFPMQLHSFPDTRRISLTCLLSQGWIKK